MLPPDSVARAAQRWLVLLRRSTLQQAAALLRSQAAYTDLTTTQYATALDWLRTTGLVADSPVGPALAPAAQCLPAPQAAQLLYSRSLEAAAPTWLPDADVLVPDSAELPQDAANLASVLGLSDAVALSSIREVHGRIDFEERSRIGLDGELGLASVLERRWPGSTVHVAASDDGFGYDLAFTPLAASWHLEVKTTTRRGRLVIYLSRHEHEVALLDPAWRLVVVGLGADSEPVALATVDHNRVLARAPHDHSGGSRWESTRHELRPADLTRGLAFLGAAERTDDPLSVIYRGAVSLPSMFAWMPA